MVVYLKNKKIVGLIVLLGCVMGLRSMSYEPCAPELTMAQHQELLDFVRAAHDSGIAFPGICALCVEEFPKYSKLAQMYAYFCMGPIERNQYEDSPELKSLRPGEFLRCCPDWSFVKNEEYAFSVLSRLSFFPLKNVSQDILCTFSNVLVELVKANDIAFICYFLRFMRDNGLMVHKTVSANFFCDTVLAGSLTGVRCLLQLSHFNLNTKCFCAGNGKTFPLLVAVMRGSLPMVALLLRRGADPELQMRIKTLCPVTCKMEKDRAHFDADPLDADPRLAEMALIPDVPDKKGETAHPGFDVYRERPHAISALSCARDYNRTFAACDDNSYPGIIASLERAIVAKRAKIASAFTPTLTPSGIIEPFECVGDKSAAGPSTRPAENRGLLVPTCVVASRSTGHVDQSSGGAPADVMRTVRTEPGELLDASSGRQPSIVDCSGWGCGCGCRVKKVKKVVEKDKDKKDRKKK